MAIKVGACGWNYLSPERFLKPTGKESLLESYAKLFDLVEVNSTFYRLPRKTTPAKWRNEVDKLNKNFEFTLKVPKVITHTHKFSPEADWAFESIKEIGRVLRSKILLFQTSAYFTPSKENIKKLRDFFKRNKREDFTLVLEVRWADKWTREIVFPLFEELELEQCVDPLRQDWLYNKRITYFRLHGFGSSMYNYAFTYEEIERIKKIAEHESNSGKEVYILFNNANCYEDGLKLKSILVNNKGGSSNGF